MPRRRTIAARLVVCAVACVVLALVARAQFQVNPQAPRQVNNALYGGGTSGSMRYSWGPSYTTKYSQALPSEVRYAQIKSGALPSEIRMNAAAIGPMAPQGPIAYVPPARDPYAKPDRPAPSPQGGAAFSTGASGTIRYSGSSTASASASPLMSAPMNTSVKSAAAQPATMTKLDWSFLSTPASTGGSSGTIRYGS
jgi:hypothetical protein